MATRRKRASKSGKAMKPRERAFADHGRHEDLGGAATDRQIRTIVRSNTRRGASKGTKRTRRPRSTAANDMAFGGRGKGSHKRRPPVSSKRGGGRIKRRKR